MSEASSNLTRFSIVIPTYNSAATLVQTLESVREQGWPNVEVLIVDGVSRDQTVEVAQSFSGLELKVVSEPDKGIYDAINKGVARATGDLICVLGSDDRLADGALKAVHESWIASGTDIVAGKALLEASDGTASLRLDEVYGPGALVSGIPFCHNSMYVTPEAYQRVGQYNLGYRICADAEWVHRSIRAGCTCARIEPALVHFSLSGTSSTNDDLIMAETYAVVAGNFPGISTPDAEILFKAVRRWTDDSQVQAVLNRYPADTLLADAVVAGLNPTSAAVATPPAQAQRLSNSLTARALRKIQRLFRSRLAND
ncbi:glycosyltransferase family 2 protein [Pseudomonas pseudonitroreducens]|uniref:glycosyltransferase family 2 protein n=1 Tax=Pseudomonas pseudonitroreducens TaxID=2892326 RepID=UPI001F47D493|nr:glycosyltransferase family 2 protein [Pseudomonas pseudonitroreducens]